MTQDYNSVSTSFCILPWVHSFVNLGGEYQVCCVSEEFENDILDKDGKNMMIQQQYDVEEVMNSPFMKELRRKMMNGDWDPLCQRCKITEDTGGFSRRMMEHRHYQDVIEDSLASMDEDYAIKPNILSADYRLGNLCNLQCRMCNPRASKLWIRDWNDMNFAQDQMSDETLQKFKEYDWIDDPDLIREFRNKCKGLRHLHFAGGEPLIAKQMRDILKVCVEEGVAENITLTYNTNLTRIPESVLELWPKFKNLRLLISIDAYGTLNDYIRMPSKWPIIDKNLRYIDKHHKELKIEEILLSSTIQAYNVTQMQDLIDYLKTDFKIVKKVPNFINLLGPDYLSTQVLPKHVKRLATERLNGIIEYAKTALDEYDHYIIDNIRGSIEFMNMAHRPSNYIKFLNYSLKVDKKYGYSLKKILPELFGAKNETASDLRTMGPPDL